VQPPNRGARSLQSRCLFFVASRRREPQLRPLAQAAAARVQVGRDPHNRSFRSVRKPVAFCFTGVNPELQTAFPGRTAETGSTAWAPFLGSAGMRFSAWSRGQQCRGQQSGCRNFGVQLCCWSGGDWTCWPAEHCCGPHSSSRFLLCSASPCCCLRDYDFISVRENLIKDYTN